MHKKNSLAGLCNWKDYHLEKKDMYVAEFKQQSLDPQSVHVCNIHLAQSDI